MTHSELFKLHELKGRLQGRATCLESETRAIGDLIPKLASLDNRAYFRGQLKILKDWMCDNLRLLDEVNRIIRETENDRE